MTRGEWDGNSTDDDLLEFFRQLPNGDRQYFILPNTAHSQGFSKNRQLLWYAMKNFLAAPAPVASLGKRRRPEVRARRWRGHLGMTEAYSSPAAKNSRSSR